jgi:predicted RNA-binding protein
LSERHNFRLKLGKSHIKCKLKSLEKYREWFPRADIEFELRGDGKTYRTYVDRGNRIRLHELLKDHPDAKVGDFLVFTTEPGSREWTISLEKSDSTTQTRLISEKPSKPKKKVRTFDHSSLQKILVSLSEYYDMHAQEEFRFEHFIFDVIWTRVPTGNPIKVFEVQVGGSLEGALTKLKHARDTWNSDLFLIVTSSKDADKAEYLLGGSFHEMRRKTVILRGSEVYEMLMYKERFGEIEQRLRR